MVCENKNDDILFNKIKNCLKNLDKEEQTYLELKKFK